MPDVIYDYTKCTGNGECAEVCPEEILEFVEEGERWCRPKEEFVVNKKAWEAYKELVEPQEDAVKIRIHNDMPDCIECLACVDECPDEAIIIESDVPDDPVEKL